MTVQAQTPPAFQPVAEYHACRLELDINTDAYFEGELPKDKLVAVFKELVDFAIEIATKGEKP